MRVYFGGPDKPAFYLRDLLAEKIDKVDGNGEIFWITYYFRDFFLAEKLIRAAERGAKVTVLLEAQPRVKNANLEILNLLKTNEKVAVKAIRHKSLHKLFSGFNPKIHEKLYYFKCNNKTSAFIGSYNPSGRENDDLNILELIGDQDRGHNFLLELNDNVFLEDLYKHCIYMKNIRHGFLENLRKWHRKIESDGDILYYFPWSSKRVLFNFFEKAVRGDIMYISISHFTLKSLVFRLYRLSKKGVVIKMISHNTKRRFPKKIENLLSKLNITFMRYTHPKQYPMHNKFVILERKKETLVASGSLNFTFKSLNGNHEILFITRNSAITQQFKDRWNTIEKEILDNNYFVQNSS
jgi:phosphatidylserine/phosphatidylglycerophosphate/cardiolipin synthase-like enzyme